MKTLFLPSVLILPLAIWPAAAAKPTPQEQCRWYYGNLKNFVQAQLYEPSAGYCQVAVQTNGKRIIGANINEGSIETCTSVVEAFDTLLYKNIPSPPSNLCRKDIIFEFKIPERIMDKQAEQETVAADGLKHKLHLQLEMLAAQK